MMRHRVPGPGRWGTHPVSLVCQLITALTANVTNTFFLGGTNVRSWLSRVTASCFTVVADSDGTVLATLKKWDKSAGAAVTLSAALDLETMVAKECIDFTLLSTLTDDQRTIDVGDSLYIEIVNNSAAINTQPVGLTFVPEFFVLV